MFKLENYTTNSLIAIKYNNLVSNEIIKIKKLIDDAIRNRKIYEKFIIIYRNEVYNNSILNYINDVQAGLIKNYNKFKLEKLYNVSDITNVNSVKIKINSLQLSSIQAEKSKLIFSYYYNFMKYAILESNLNLRLEQYEIISSISDSMVIRLFKLYFKLISIQILKTGKFLLPYNIHVKIRGKSFSRIEKKYGNKNRNVDWNKSLKTLLSIAKDANINLYNKYINKDIKKNEFIQQMKPFVYNKDTNPTGLKWIVKRDKDFSLWLVLWTRYSSLKNIKFYNIVPTNFIANNSRSQIQFTKDSKSVDDIIRSNKLGFRDKLKVLERFDINYCLNTFDNDL